MRHFSQEQHPSLPFLPSCPFPPSHSSPQLELLSDPILAYSYPYPIESVSGKPLRMILAHAPEKYSSAAPLTVSRVTGEVGEGRCGVGTARPRCIPQPWGTCSLP